MWVLVPFNFRKSAIIHGRVFSRTRTYLSGAISSMVDTNISFHLFQYKLTSETSLRTDQDESRSF